MTVSDRISLETKRALKYGPPWPVRILGMAMVGADAAWWMVEATPAEWLHMLIELAKHGTILLIGMTLAYPEGATRLMSFARQFPLLNRRSRRR